MWGHYKYCTKNDFHYVVMENCFLILISSVTVTVLVDTLKRDTFYKVSLISLTSLVPGGISYKTDIEVCFREKNAM